jgi:hypothetical protein
VTAGKKDGHGIGLTQVRETVEKYHGTINFDSVVGQGTQVVLEFPRIKTPDWMAEKIALMPGDTVVILDDDASIHGAWASQFASLLEASSSIELKHFSHGQEALDFIQSFPKEERSQLFLLTDYELLKQDLDGLMVIEKSQLPRALLVTSHYVNTKVRERAKKINCKILPKQMASEIQITVKTTKEKQIIKDKKIEDQPKKAEVKAEIDVVIVDDDQSFGNHLALFLPDRLKVDVYQKPEVLLEQITQYDLKTTFLLDQHIVGSDFSGMMLAKVLYEKGYKNLHILSGKTFEVGEVPDYLSVILKTDLDQIEELFQENG